MALRSDNLLLRRYVDKAMVDLPALPSVVLQIVQATEQETVTTNEIEGLLSKDPAITTKLLKVVNSAYFGLPRQIVNVNQTIAILGMHQVRSLVMSIGVLNVLNSSSPRIVEVQKAFWQHAFGSASCAETIARSKNLPKKEAEMVFVGALLHDVGRLFLITLFNLPYTEVLKESVKNEEPVQSVEARVLGTTHAELGGMLAEKWNFPPVLVKMIRDHDTAPTSETEGPVMCAHIADAMANSLSNPEMVGLCSPVGDAALAWLGYSAADLEKLREQTAIQVEKASDVLGIL